MISRRLSSKREESFQEPMINVTPLIDVVFVLLISFIIVAPLLETDQVDLASSEGVPTHKPMGPQSPLTIQVLRDNSIIVEGVKVSLKDLPSRISNLKKRYPKEKPQLLYDKRASFGTYQEIKNCLEILGFSEMDIILAPS